MGERTMNETTPPLLPFWKECLRVLYWVFFKPLTLRRYVNSLEPDLPKNYSLWQARRKLCSNRKLQGLLWATLFDTLILPWILALLIVPVEARITGSPIDWTRVAVGVAFGVVIGVVLGVMFGVVADMAFGVVWGVAWDIGFAVVFGVAVGVTSGVGRGVAFDVAIGTAFGIAFGITIGVAIGVAIGVELNMVFGVVLGVVIGVAFGWAAGVASIIYCLRIFLYLPELLWIWLLRLIVRFQPALSVRLLRFLPPHFDEVIWFPLFGLIGLLRQASHLDMRAALDEVFFLINSLTQRGQARFALADMIAYAFEDVTNIEALALFSQEGNWLPDDLKQVRPDAAEILPGLFAISRELGLAIQSGSPLSQRLALRETMDQLDGLQKKLNHLGREGKERWGPVLAKWYKVMQSGLEQAAHFSQSTGGVENPYQAGTPLPLSRRNLFKGRQELAADIANALRERGRPTLILHGPRRMGKTSFLLQLPALLPGRTVPAFISLQDPAATSSDSSFLYAIAHAITRDAQPQRLILPAPERERFESRPFEALDEWLARAAKALQDFNLLLTFDEFEQAGAAFESGQLSRNVLNELRTLIEHQQKMALLFAGVQTLDELGPGWSSYFINARTLTMGYLQRAEAEELIRNPDPQVPFELSYDDDVVERILEETLGHPYLVQLVCSCLVECANRHDTRLADEELIEEAEELAFERGANYFNNVWLEMAGEDGQSLLRQVAAVHILLKLDPQDAAQRKALSRMLRLKVLHRSESGYTVEVPLVARWVNEYAPD